MFVHRGCGPHFSVACQRRPDAAGITFARFFLNTTAGLGGMFDLATAVETHFWWPNLPGDMREVFRVMKPGGTLVLIAEIYKGANTMAAKLAEKYASRTGMTLLSVNEHRELYTNAGYSDVQVIEERDKGWICGIGRKPIANS